MKTRTPILIFSLVMALLCQLSMAQKNESDEQRQEKFQAMKIAYYSEQIEFTAEEAEVFWPVYNKYDKAKQDNRKSRKNNYREFSNMADELSDRDVEALINKRLELNKEEFRLETELNDKLMQILPPKKVMRFYLTEIHFRDYILDQIRKDQDDSRSREDRRDP